MKPFHCAESPHRVAVMRSGTSRFKTEKAVSVTPFGAYRIDAANRKDIASSVRGAVLLAESVQLLFQTFTLHPPLRKSDQHPNRYCNIILQNGIVHTRVLTCAEYLPMSLVLTHTASVAFQS